MLNVHRYWDSVAQRISARKDLSKFLTWDVIRATMFACNPPALQTKFDVLKQRWDVWRPILDSEPEFGEPTKSVVYEKASGNLINQCFHIDLFERMSETDITNLKLITEFGGGYGLMAWIVRKRGFCGQYYIYDLPQISALQRQYLDIVGVDAQTISDLSQIPSYTDLFIAIHSFDETPTENRGNFLSFEAKQMFFAYGESFERDVLNTSWFNSLAVALGHKYKFKRGKIGSTQYLLAQ